MPFEKIFSERAKMSFIVCEGLDGAGKTTGIKNALEYLPGFIYSRGLKTDTPAGRISKAHPSTLTLLTELLYLDRTFVRPNLERGYNIVQDRWYFSPLSHNPENKRDRLLEKIFIPCLTKPDLLVYYTVSL